MRVARCIALFAAAGIAGISQAQETPLYSQNFEGAGGSYPEWNAGMVLSDGGSAFTKFNGRYSNGSTTLTLALPAGRGIGGGPAPTTWFRMHLVFDLYAIDSWDGDAVWSSDHTAVVGPDHFLVTADGVTIFDETISNVAGRTQSMRAPNIGPSFLGYRSDFRDSIYRQISLYFDAAPGQPVSITWGDSGLQGLTDESWGIDNINVSYSEVPAPGAAAVLGAAGLAGLRRRRR